MIQLGLGGKKRWGKFTGGRPRGKYSFVLCVSPTFPVIYIFYSLAPEDHEISTVQQLRTKLI